MAALTVFCEVLTVVNCRLSFITGIGIGFHHTYFPSVIPYFHPTIHTIHMKRNRNKMVIGIGKYVIVDMAVAAVIVDRLVILLRLIDLAMIMA
jgi:hypothetical protein